MKLIQAQLRRGIAPGLRRIALAAALFGAAGWAGAADQASAKSGPGTKTESPETKGSTAGTSAPQPAFKSEREKRSYALGMGLAEKLRMNHAVDIEVFLQGFEDTLTNNALLSDRDAKGALGEMQSDLKSRRSALAEQRESMRQKGEAFLAENKAKAGVVTRPSGLQYKVVKAGEGKMPKLDDVVTANYRATLIDGTEVDSSYGHKGPLTFPVKRVIKGWAEALQLMPVGSKWQLFIPPNLAYGSRGGGRNVGPDTTLVFEVELLGIKPREAQAEDKKAEATDDAAALVADKAGATAKVPR
jgi:FKBP-type peptidyl-prolyl cis-trans isomerase FklB